MANALGDKREATARELARRLYRGMTDRHGRPQLEHMEAVVARCGTDVKVLAWLHDVVEDGLLSIDEVEDEVGLKPAETDALLLLSRDGSTSYEAYIELLATAPDRSGELARKVKRADLAANLSRPPLADRPELALRYRAALERLGDVPRR
jgi:hypothetical protein